MKKFFGPAVLGCLLCTSVVAKDVAKFTQLDGTVIILTDEPNQGRAPPPMKFFTAKKIDAQHKLSLGIFQDDAAGNVMVFWLDDPKRTLYSYNDAEFQTVAALPYDWRTGKPLPVVPVSSVPASDWDGKSVTVPKLFDTPLPDAAQLSRGHTSTPPLIDNFFEWMGNTFEYFMSHGWAVAALSGGLIGVSGALGRIGFRKAKVPEGRRPPNPQ